MRSKPLLIVGLKLVFVAVVVACLIENVFCAPSGMQDTCRHNLKKSTGFFGRHFDGSFWKKALKHVIPFTSSPRVKMQFFLYKKDFAECGRELIMDDIETLRDSGFNAAHPTRIIIHGWMSQSKGRLNRAVKDAYLSLTQKRPYQYDAFAATTNGSLEKNLSSNDENENSIEAKQQKHNDDSDINANDYLHYDEEDNINDLEMDEEEIAYRNARAQITDFNVIVVDWSVISSNVNYFEVVDMIDDLGFLLAEFVRFLHMQSGLHYNDVYLIGHSLGAQIAGSSGKQIRPFKFNTIFALDPAGPKFRNQQNEYRIDSTDAYYVESIQTSVSLGFEQPVGNATFYPNFGRDQKKCYMYGCSHSRAHHYFAESITSNRGFWGVRCERQSEKKWLFPESKKQFRMGGEPSTPKEGTFYVKTNDRRPYAMGKNRTIQSSH